jgi:nucleotide-binding universal stress UspA family protein
MMSEPHTAPAVVVGVDGSEGSRQALRWALEEAADRGRPVRAVSVWQRTYNYGSEAYWPIDEDISRRAAQQLAQAVDDCGHDYPNVQVEQVVLEGDPAQVLCAQSEQAGLLVVGSRGRKTFTGLLLGSVSTKCAHHSRCPVVIVPTTRPDDGHEPELDTPETERSGVHRRASPS